MKPLYDPILESLGWYDETAYVEGWLDSDFGPSDAAPTATLTLRPNGAGNQNQWNAEGGDYTRVDEVSSDGDSTRLYTPTDNRVSTFALDDHTSESGTITNVRVYINTRGLDPISNSVQLAIRTGGTDYFSSTKTYNNTSYHEEYADWATNPNTSSAWTWSDIDALEAGMKRISGGGQAVTQVWVVVTYQTSGDPSDSSRSARISGQETTNSARSARIRGVPLLEDFTYHKVGQIDHTLVSGSGNQTSRPVLVKIASDNDMRTVANGGYVQNANGYDIVFSVDGETILDHELVYYNAATGALVAVVKVPTLYGSSDTELRRYFGNAAITTSLENATGVYDSNYKGVWHMNQDPSGTAPQIRDSTANGYHMTSSGSMTSGDLVAGQVRQGIDFDGTDDYLENTAWSSVISGNGARTISLIFKISAMNARNWVSWGAASSNQLSSAGDYDNKIGFLGFANDHTYDGSAYDDGNFHKLSITHDGSTIKVLLDGVERVSASTTLSTSTAASLFFGRYVGGAYLPGVLEWIRISNVARSNDWEITDYNMEFNASFITWGTLQGGATEVNDSRSARITGTDTANNTRAGRIAGSDAATDNRAARIAGQDAASDARGARVAGKDTSTDSREARITGALVPSDSRSARVAGTDTANDTRGGRITGMDTSGDSRGARIDGVAGADSSRSARVAGIATADDSRSARIAGKDTALDSRDARIMGQDSAADSRGSRVAGVDVANDSRSARIAGKDTTEATRSARITGVATADDARQGRITGQDTIADTRLARVAGKDTTGDSRPARLAGQSEADNTRQGRLAGKDEASSTRAARITGKDTASDVAAARITGAIATSDSRNARIAGVHVYPYTDGASPYQNAQSPYTDEASHYSRKPSPYSDGNSPYSKW